MWVYRLRFRLKGMRKGNVVHSMIDFNGLWRGGLGTYVKWQPEVEMEAAIAAGLGSFGDKVESGSMFGQCGRYNLLVRHADRPF